MRHLTVQQISASLDGALSGVSLELVVRHLSSCHECRERHARLTKQDDALRRLLACEFSDVFYDDMFARLGAVLEADSRGQMPPEHALPPELPPLEPEKPPTREMPRPPSAAMRHPALISEEEQKRRAAEELKAAETAAINSLEELMREMRELKGAAAAPARPEPAAEPRPAPPAPEAAAGMPASILALPPHVLASLRDVSAAHPETEPASPPEPEPEPAPEAIVHPEPEPEPAREPLVVEPVGAEPGPEPGPIREEVAVDWELPLEEPSAEPALAWEVVDGPLPIGPDFGDATPAPAEPEPWPAPAPEPEPAPAPVHEVELERIHVPAPEPATMLQAEPGRVVVHEPPVAPRAPHVPNPVDDPYADYEERLVPEPPKRPLALPLRRVRKRHLAGAAVGVVALLAALGGSGYLPAVIRVPVPELPRPRVPRIEVVRVPLATPGPSRRDGGANPAERPDASVAPSRENGTHVVPTPKPLPPVTATSVAKPAVPKPASEPAPRAAAPATRPAPVASEPPAPARRPESEPEPARAVAKPAAPEPIHRTTPPAPAPAAPQTAEPEVDEGASWPLLCGIVLDETGAPVAGARIALADLDLGARTDRRGRFCIAAPPGDRTLSVVAAGFATHRRVVSLGTENLEVSIPLTPAP